MPTGSGSASITIDRSPAEVFEAVSDVTRTGEWSPECTAGRWVGEATGPAVGATFEGDNKAVVAGRTLKRWTTTSEVTACEPGAVFEFVAAGMTTWRYDFAANGTGTTVTESFSYENKGFVNRYIYGMLLRRPAQMVKGMHTTLARLKTALEG